MADILNLHGDREDSGINIADKVVVTVRDIFHGIPVNCGGRSVSEGDGVARGGGV